MSHIEWGDTDSASSDDDAVYDPAKDLVLGALRELGGMADTFAGTSRSPPNLDFEAAHQTQMTPYEKPQGRWPWDSDPNVLGTIDFLAFGSTKPYVWNPKRHIRLIIVLKRMLEHPPGSERGDVMVMVARDLLPPEEYEACSSISLKEELDKTVRNYSNHSKYLG
ncbi:hypothetical protein RQP46_008096 [Phenoliferia psychrophenolica]